MTISPPSLSLPPFPLRRFGGGTPGALTAGVATPFCAFDSPSLPPPLPSSLQIRYRHPRRTHPRYRHSLLCFRLTLPPSPLPSSLQIRCQHPRRTHSRYRYSLRCFRLRSLRRRRGQSRRNAHPRHPPRRRRGGHDRLSPRHLPLRLPYDGLTWEGHAWV